MTAADRASAFLTIDLDAVTANWRHLRQVVGERCTVAAVVKADAYGLGARQVAPALHRAGCRFFFVATIDEGIALRKILRKPAIYVLGGPLPGAAADLAEHDLTPVLNSAEQIGLWAGYAKGLGKPLEALLHLDTGMSRLGLDETAIALLVEDPSLLDGIRPVMVMSHMACADEEAHPKNPQQLAAFRILSERLNPSLPRSLGASSTIFLGPDHHFDMVRPGAALYGLNPTPGRPNPMAATVRLAGRILQVRDVDTPMTVGYGASHQIARRGRIATVALGYADGIFRSLGNRGFGVIEGERVPVIGRISMDLTTFDVSAVAPEAARPGALIELIGPSHSVDELAEEAGTIGYEILTALGQRYHRIYQGGAV